MTRTPVVTALTRGGDAICPRCTVAQNPLARMKGLLGKRALDKDAGLLLRPASSIHTLFMRFSIDVVFLDRELVVRKVAAGVPPWRFAFGLGSRAVLELPAGTCEARRITPGDRLVASPPLRQT